MNNTQYLSDDTILLRIPEPYDLDIIYQWENDTTLWNVGCATAPFSRKLIEEYIAEYNPDIYSAKQLRLMIVRKNDNAPIGAIDLYDFDPHNRRAAAGIIIDSRFRHQGYGLRALNLLADYCHSMLGMHQLHAIIPVTNESSIKLFQKAGFKICGRYRSWLRRGASYEDAFSLQKLFN
ncbi:MAG: GNAT family N-acetyltransferase [Bacteroides sp.]|nr:GNAT family N-acetyltransferase [Bacteroides sp.]